MVSVFGFSISGVLELALTLVGAAFSLNLGWSALNGLIGFLASGSDPRRYGKWAVVTGATDGIGKAYAMELARKGMSVVLISRSADRLEEASKEIKAKYPKVEVKTIVADFSDTSDALYQSIGAQLQGLDLGVLINNVGVSYEHAQYLTELPLEREKMLIDINVTATTRMTRVVLPAMRKQRRGAIINVASAAGVIPCGDPLYAVYSASKAYMDFFSRSLNLELRNEGIFVQCQVPYFVTTKLSKLRRASLLIPTPGAYARAAVAWIGRGGATVVPYPAHAIQHAIMCALPAPLLEMLVLSHHKGIRAKALKKATKAE